TLLLSSPSIFISYKDIPSRTRLRFIVLVVLYHYDSVPILFCFCDTSRLFVLPLGHFARFIAVIEHPFPHLPPSLLFVLLWYTLTQHCRPSTRQREELLCLLDYAEFYLR